MQWKLSDISRKVQKGLHGQKLFSKRRSHSISLATAMVAINSFKVTHLLGWVEVSLWEEVWSGTSL